MEDREGKGHMPLEQELTEEEEIEIEEEVHKKALEFRSFDLSEEEPQDE